MNHRSSRPYGLRALLLLWPFFGLLLAGLPGPALPAPAQRTLEIRLSVDATQDWRREPAWSKATSEQRYDFSSQLRSDGRLYVENLLDPDPARRLQIKSDWYLFQGLSELKTENGGKLPIVGAGAAVLSSESIMASGGMASPLMGNMSPQRMTALQALSERDATELEAFMRRYDQPGGRWMYFEGFEGCVNRLQVRHHSRFEGDSAKKRGNSVPFTMQWDADGNGTPEQRQGLCRRYVATYEPSTDTLIVENLYLPAPLGVSIRNHFGRSERQERELPPPYEVLRWVDQTLKQVRSVGKRSDTLPITAALDANDAALGNFTGTAQVSLEWSFR